MFEEIVSIIGGVCLPLIWLYILKAPVMFKRITGLKMIKPFSCGFCLAFWIAFIYLICKTNLIDSIFISSAAPFLYIYFEDLILNKWNF